MMMPLAAIRGKTRYHIQPDDGDDDRWEAVLRESIFPGQFIYENWQLQTRNATWCATHQQFFIGLIYDSHLTSEEQICCQFPHPAKSAFQDTTVDQRSLFGVRS